MSYFDGTFHVIKYPEGSKLYNGTRFGREFPIGEKFYEPVNPATPLPDGFMRALVNDDKRVTLTFSEFYKEAIKTGWYSDPISAGCDNCGIAAYVLKKDAVFINIEKGEDVIKLIRRTKDQKLSNFLEWLCSGVDSESYAGYTLGRDKELFLCNALEYLERDLTDDKDWQHVEKPKDRVVVDKYLDQLKLYKTPNVNRFAGNLYEQTVWTLLHLEDILSRPNLYAVLSKEEKTALAAAALVSKIGCLDGDASIRRRTDFLILTNMVSVEAENFLSGKRTIPEFRIEGDVLVPEKPGISGADLLSQLNVSKRSDFVDIIKLVKTHTVLFRMIELYNKDPEKAVTLYLERIKNAIGETPTRSFMYRLLALSVASIRAMQPPPDPRERSIYFPFVKNVPKNFRGGIFSAIDKVNFVDGILSKLSVDKPRDIISGQNLREGPMWYKTRISIGKAITQKLDEIEISQWKRCLSGDYSKDFKARLGETSVLGAGTFGQVYLSSIGSEKIVIKEALLEDEEKAKMAPHTKNGFPQNSIPTSLRCCLLRKTFSKRSRVRTF